MLSSSEFAALPSQHLRQAHVFTEALPVTEEMAEQSVQRVPRATRFLKSMSVGRSPVNRSAIWENYTPHEH